MKHLHNQRSRGSHATVLDQALPKLKESQRVAGVTGIKNGPIKLGIKARGRSVKVVVEDASHLRLDVVTPGSKQTFWVYTRDGQAKPVARRLETLWSSF